MPIYCTTNTTFTSANYVTAYSYPIRLEEIVFLVKKLVNNSNLIDKTKFYVYEDSKSGYAKLIDLDNLSIEEMCQILGLYGQIHTFDTSEDAALYVACIN